MCPGPCRHCARRPIGLGGGAALGALSGAAPRVSMETAKKKKIKNIKNEMKKRAGWPLTHAAINYYLAAASVLNKDGGSDGKHFHGRSESKGFQSQWIYERSCVSGIFAAASGCRLRGLENTKKKKFFFVFHGFFLFHLSSKYFKGVVDGVS